MHIEVHEPDTKQGIMGLFADYKTFLCRKKMENRIDENPKVAIGHIYNFLKPPALKKKLENDLALH